LGLQYTAAVIPIRDAVPSPTRPLVTLALLAMGAVATLLVGPIHASPPWSAASTAEIEAAGAGGGPLAWLWAALSLVRPSGWFQGVTCAMALWIFGPTVEDRVGHGRYIALWLGSAAAAAIVAAVAGTPVSSIVLLPGAVGGLVGAHAALYPKARTVVLIPTPQGLDTGDVPVVLLAGFWLAAQVAASIPQRGLMLEWSPGLALAQAAAGIASGIVAARVLARPERMRVEWWSP
jgi:hypothetical protein